MRATDADLTAPNNVVSYSVIAGDPTGVFSFNTATGELRTRGPLDYESGVISYTLQILSSDGAQNPPTATCTVQINVTDVNDNSPIFNASSYVATIPEGTASDVTLVTVLATDADSGENGVVRYGLTDPSQLFTISPISGVISTVVTPTNFFNFEQTRQYVVTVIASDVGAPGQLSRSTTTRLLVTITDVNDLPPLFSAAAYTASVPENANGTAVVAVSAADQDQVAVSILRYEMVTQSIPFTINPSTGVITTDQPLDRETTDAYTFQVRVVETDNAAHTDTATVSVTVTDVNDHVPTFSDPSRLYFLRLNETTLIGTDLIQFQASDGDLAGSNNARFDFTLVAGNEDRRFVLSQSGLLELNNGLDFEARSSYTLTVTVRDRGDPSLAENATVQVTVLNANDLRPTFNASTYSATVLENATVGVQLTQVFGTDPEVGTILTYVSSQSLN